jgi:hypothetical protein
MRLQFPPQQRRLVTRGLGVQYKLRGRHRCLLSEARPGFPAPRHPCPSCRARGRNDPGGAQAGRPCRAQTAPVDTASPVPEACAADEQLAPETRPPANGQAPADDVECSAYPATAQAGNCSKRGPPWEPDCFVGDFEPKNTR